MWTQTHMRYGRLLRTFAFLGTLLLWNPLSAWAGPVIIDGTDANNYGFAAGCMNVDGWLYMQRVLENLAAQVPASAAKVVVNLGTSGRQAGAAITSAFTLSSLPAAG